jgi:hypothetical protein
MVAEQELVATRNDAAGEWPIYAVPLPPAARFHGNHAFVAVCPPCVEDGTGRPKVACCCERCNWLAIVFLDAPDEGHGHAYTDPCPHGPRQLPLFCEAAS